MSAVATGAVTATTTVLLAALALSACATLSPAERSSYDKAQTEVHQFEADPLANRAAGEPLQQARTDLANADTAARHHDAAGVTYWSYLATREAQIGQAMIAELRTREQVADATAQRDRLLLALQRRRTQQAQQQAAQAEQRAQNAEQTLQQQQQDQQQAQQQQQLAQARTETEQARQQAQQAAQQEQQARQQLAALQVRQTEQGMVLTLGGSLLFATGRDVLEPGAAQSLNNVAAFLQQHPMVKLRIQGFTDDRGSDAFNDALSERRAQAVAKALESDGIGTDRLQAIGRGASLPVANNTSAAGRQQNRRVELLFSDTQGRFASNQAPEQLR